MFRHLDWISRQETDAHFPCSEDDIELIQQTAQGDMRRAILLLQVALETGKCGDVFAVSQSEPATIAASALTALRDGDVRVAIRKLEALMIDYGLSGDEVFAEIRAIIQREYNHPSLAVALASAEYRLRHCNNEYLQVGSFAASVHEVFP